jgi:hypothetical protein
MQCGQGDAKDSLAPVNIQTCLPDFSGEQICQILRRTPEIQSSA